MGASPAFRPVCAYFHPQAMVRETVAAGTVTKRESPSRIILIRMNRDSACLYGSQSLASLRHFYVFFDSLFRCRYLRDFSVAIYIVECFYAHASRTVLQGATLFGSAHACPSADAGECGDASWDKAL